MLLTYHYRCYACDHRFDLKQRITEDAKATCPECGSHDCKRQIQASSFVLKGGGWYADGYGKKR